MSGRKSPQNRNFWPRSFICQHPLNDSRAPLQGLTFRMLLLTLYGVGLRPSEGLRLRCCDVDLDHGIIAIWDTKFFKSRLVPIGTALTVALGTYRRARQALPMPALARSAFFAAHTGREITLSKLERTFVRLRDHAGIASQPGAKWQPRLHDMRHYPARRIIPTCCVGSALSSAPLADRPLAYAE